MNERTEKKFIWGNYDYSNNNQENNINNNNNNLTDDNKGILNPIKEKIKEGIGKINSSELYNKLKNKISNDKTDKENTNYNKSGLINYTPNLEDTYEVNDYQITCKIDEYKDRVVGKEHIIFYKIELSSALSGKKWDVYHSFQEFNDLYVIYQKLYLDVPIINWTNSKTIIKEPIVHRQLISELHSFVNDILKKPALLTSSFIVEFLELQNHFNDISIYKPLLRYDSNYDEMYTNNLCINCVLFLEESKLLLVGTGLGKDEKIEDINNNINNNNNGSSKYFGFINKIGKIFKKDKQEMINTCRGKFYIYNIIHNNNGEIMMVEIHCSEVISEIVKIEFWQQSNIVILGLNNGQILFFKLYIKEMNITSKEILEYIGTINYHTTPTLCCIINFKEGYSYSFAQYETGVKICELNYQSLIKELSIYNNIYKKNKKNKGIICVDYTISFEYIYIQDDEGSIFFIDIITDPLNPYIVCCLPKFLKGGNNFEGEKNLGKIIAIKNSYYLFVGETNLDDKRNKNKYILNIYLILIDENNNNDETIQLIKMKQLYLYGLISITNIEISDKEDIIISLSNGSICIFNHSCNSPEYIISYHYKKLTNFIWYEKQKSIISVSLDKSIKVYQIPFKWPAEFIRKNKEVNDFNIISNIIQETKNIYYNTNSNNSYNNYYNNYMNYDNNDNDNDNENKNGHNINNIRNYGNFWDVGNLDSRNNAYKIIKSIKSGDNKKDNKDNNEKLFINNNINILNVYNINKNQEKSFENNKNYYSNNNIEYKIENYEEYFNIFSDDLDGWSNENSS